ncbi:unnamed protein product [Discosporangium mesarthrocarpum]
MLAGKRALVFGVANKRSIAWGIANRWRGEGASVFVTYQASCWLILLMLDERFQKQVENLVREEWGPFSPELPLPVAACDVAEGHEVASLMKKLEARRFCYTDQGSGGVDGEVIAPGVGGAGGGIGGGLPKLDAILHSVAFAPTEAMKGGSFLQVGLSSRDLDLVGGGVILCPFHLCASACSLLSLPPLAMSLVPYPLVLCLPIFFFSPFLQSTTKEAFVQTHVVSAYSLVEVARNALPYMSPASSITTLSYIGSQKVVPSYNVMGPAKASLESCARTLAHELGEHNIRVNCLSPGPVRTLAARGISGFDAMHKSAMERSPLGRTAAMEEITAVATFLASPQASAVTGQTLFVDCGFNVMA